jgi:riboflavin synthase
MFTGLITHTTRLSQLKSSASAHALYLEPVALTPDPKIGESIAVDGCCLTLIESTPLWRFDILEETLVRTHFKSIASGSILNIERALTLETRLGGHIVTGHIDCTATVIRWEPVIENETLQSSIRYESGAGNYLLEIETRPEDQPLLIEKGSIAVNGISLTIAQVHSRSIILYIIPHTRAHTNLSQLKSGDSVNVEFDLFAKLIQKNITHHFQSISKYDPSTNHKAPDPARTRYCHHSP